LSILLEKSSVHCKMAQLLVRPLTLEDIPPVISYWRTRTDENLEKMGVDKSKLANLDLEKALKDSLALPIEEAKIYFVIWVVDDVPIGHSNINKIDYGEEATMHLHVWFPEQRQRGYGQELVKLSLENYFQTFKLKRVFCEPNAYNEAPNKTLPKVGFQLIQENLVCIPGWINFEQPINRYEITRERYESLYGPL
jgi:ribosomal-protein-alanine N-acetyltransferase